MMHYQFPVLGPSVDLNEVIAGRDEFSNHIKGEPGARYQVWDYAVNFKDTFPSLTGDPVADRIPILRRELRGLITCPDTGEVLSRAWHKFFNVGERDEVAPDRVDLRRRHWRLEKMDGSMIRPFVPADDKLHWNVYPTRPLLWGTMAGVTDVAKNAQAFLESTNVPYEIFSRHMVEDGWTPIFEWCSRKNRIVVDYPTDRLVLTGIRHRQTGEYMNYDDILIEVGDLGIPVVDMHESDGDLARIIAETRAQQEGEGYVIRFDDGHMLKIKADLYCLIHKTKEHLVFEKNLVTLILNKGLDDALPHILDTDRARVEAYADTLNRNLTNMATTLSEFVKIRKDRGVEKREFAMEAQNLPYRSILFSIYDGKDPMTLVREYVLKRTGTTSKLEGVREFIGPKWETY